MPIPIDFPLCLASAERSLGVELLATLAVAALVALLAQRLKLAAAPAFLLAGVVAGPSALRIVASPENLTDIGHIATMLLLFGVGLELRFERTGKWRDGARLASAGALSCVLCVLVGWPFAALFGLGWGASLAVSMAMSISSTALVLRALSLRRELRRPHGRASLAVLIVQDLAALAMLAILPLLAHREGGSFFQTVGSAAFSLAGVVVLLVLGKLLAGRILREAARGPEGVQLMTIVAVVMAVGAGIATQSLGLSPELGAFLAGFLLADTPFRHQITGAVAPMRDVLIAVFFTSVGMFVDPALAIENAGVILLAGVLVTVVKTLAIGASMWAFGSSAPTSLYTGLALAHGGEFSLVVLSAAAAIGVIDQTVFGLSVTVIVVSLVATPLMMNQAARLAPRATRWPLAPWIRSNTSESASGPTVQDHVIIAGYGPVGRSVAEQLAIDGVPFVIIDLNPDTVNKQDKLGRLTVYGDASNPDVLESAGISTAAALALTIPDDAAAVRACAVAIRLAPDLYIVARTSSLGQGNLARSSGARDVVIEEVTAARLVRDAVVQHLGARPAKKPT